MISCADSISSNAELSIRNSDIFQSGCILDPINIHGLNGFLWRGYPNDFLVICPFNTPERVVDWSRGDPTAEPGHIIAAIKRDVDMQDHTFVNCSCRDTYPEIGMDSLPWDLGDAAHMQPSSHVV
jgi:hypothetical protein